MQRETANEIKVLYDQSSPYLDGIISARNQLLPLLAGLDEQDRGRINAAMHEYAGSGSNKESFVAPDIFTSLPSVSRSVDALNSFMRKALPDDDPRKLPAPLTDIEIAQANMRWEPFDQFWNSVIALDAALDKAVFTDHGKQQVLKGLTHKIRDNCMQTDTSEGYQETGGLGFILSGSGSKAKELDMLFPEAARELSGQEVPDDDSSKIQQLERKTDEIIKAQGKLEKFLAGLPGDEKQHITGMAQRYAAQCSPEEQRTQLCEAIGVLLNGGGESVSGGVFGLRETLMRMRIPSSFASNASGLDQVAQDPLETLMTLRTPVRALSAIMDAMNTAQDGTPFNAGNLNAPGKYDEAMQLANDIAGKTWSVRSAISQDNPLKSRIQEKADFLEHRGYRGYS